MTVPTLINKQTALGNLTEASVNIGSGGGAGETFLKVDDRSGALTFGQERNPLPSGHRFVVGLHAFRHGYIDMQGGQVIERNVVSMADQPARPTPPQGYGTYEGGGPRNVTEVVLNSIDELGFNLVFTAWNVSSANRVRNLLTEALMHVKTPDGQGGFIHPVIAVKSSMYPLRAKVKPDGTMIPARDVWHWDYQVVDWLHEDGKTLLSTRGGSLPRSDPAPWDDAEDEGMTEAERDLLRA